MAQAQTAGTQTAPKAPEAPKPPGEGWEGAGRPDIDAWLKAEPGLVVYGKVVGFFAYEIQDKQSPTGKRTREAICLAVAPGTTVKAQKKGGEEVTLKEGQILAASMMYALEGARPYLSNYQEGKTYLWVHFKSKAPIGGGQTVWKAELKMKGPKGAPAVAVLAGKGGDDGSSLPSGDDSEIPF